MLKPDAGQYLGVIASRMANANDAKEAIEICDGESAELHHVATQVAELQERLDDGQRLGTIDLEDTKAIADLARSIRHAEGDVAKLADLLVNRQNLFSDIASRMAHTLEVIAEAATMGKHIKEFFASEPRAVRMSKSARELVAFAEAMLDEQATTAYFNRYTPIAAREAAADRDSLCVAIGLSEDGPATVHISVDDGLGRHTLVPKTVMRALLSGGIKELDGYIRLSNGSDEFQTEASRFSHVD